jgi:hypothetical protein
MESAFIYPAEFYEKFKGLENMMSHLNISTNSSTENTSTSKTIIWNIFSINLSSKICNTEEYPKILVRHSSKLSILALDHFKDWYFISDVPYDFKYITRNLETLFTSEIKDKILIDPLDKINNIILSPILTLKGCLIIGIFILNQKPILKSLGGTTLYSFLVKINPSIKTKFNIFSNIDNENITNRTILLRYGSNPLNQIIINNYELLKLIVPYGILFEIKVIDRKKEDWNVNNSKLQLCELYDTDIGILDC